MKCVSAVVCLVWLGVAVSLRADDVKGTVILEDNFERAEQDDALEQVGNGWATNSKARAQGVKQADLVDGTLLMTRAEVADHGVSVTHEVSFKDAMIELRFKIGKEDDLGINIADMNEKSVHAGHLCMARIRPTQLEISDLKTGRMNLKNRELRLEGKLPDDEQQRINAKSKQFKTNIAPDEWHQLKVQIKGDEMSVSVDGKPIGRFQSEGIAHATKSRLRLAVNRSAWVDDVTVVRLQ